MCENKEEEKDVKSLNIYQKLAEIRKGSVYVKKNAEGYKFKYATGSDFIGSLRSRMDEMNVILVPNMEEFDIIPYLKNPQALKIKISYTWINADKPEEQLKTSYTFIEDKMTGCQGVGSLMTYCERYYLCKFFQIATSDDDPEKYYSKHGLSAKAEDAKEVKQEVKRVEREELTQEQKDEIINFWVARGEDIDKTIAADFLEKCIVVFSKEPEKLAFKLDLWANNSAEFLSAYKKYEKKFNEAKN